MRRITTALFSCLTAYQISCDNHIEPEIPYVSVVQYRANSKIEDRVCYGKIQKIKGLVAAVFDGHGGDIVADFAAGNLIRFLNQRISQNYKKSKEINSILQSSLKQTFNDLENGYKAIFLKNIDNIDYQRVGACALAAIIVNNCIIVANSGDCQGVLLGDKQPQKINQRHNAGEPSEQKRLKAEFPNEKDIYSCYPGTNYCYVKGRLQPTRSLGDFYLKNSQYNFTNLQTFTGPYITHEPQMKKIQISLSDYNKLVLASDGLWDELDANEMNRINKQKNNLNLAVRLFLSAKQKILKRNYIKQENLDKLDDRRKLHDDISIISIDLAPLMKQFSGGHL